MTEISADDAVLTGLVAWLDALSESATHTVTGHHSPAAGYSSKTVLVDVDRSVGGVVNPQRIVLKLPPPGPAIFERYDFRMQAAVQEGVAAAGIPAATPAVAEDDTRWLGTPFLVMPLIDGRIIGEAPPFDAGLRAAGPEANAALHRTYLDLVADINRLDWRGAGLGHTVPERDNAGEIGYWRAYLDWYGGGEDLVPTLTSALEWCDAHRPATEPVPSLLWGDVRLGNLILDDQQRPRAVLDWEMASIGAAEHDLAWLLALEEVMEVLTNRRVPGFLSREECVVRYQERLGRPVEFLEWYEIFAVVRSTAILSRIAHLNDQAGKHNHFAIADNPILDLLASRIHRASI